MKKLLRLALIVGGVVAVAKIVGAKRAQWEGLTEAEVRTKLGEKLPSRMAPDKQAAVTDKVVETMRARGVLREEEAAPETGGNGGVAVESDEQEESSEAS